MKKWKCGTWVLIVSPPPSLFHLLEATNTHHHPDKRVKYRNLENGALGVTARFVKLSRKLSNCMQNLAELCRILQNLAKPWRTMKNLTELCRKNASCESVIDHYEQVPKYYMQTITIAITLQYLPCFQICSFFRTFDLVWKIWMETQHKKKSGQRLPSFLQEISVYSIKSRKVGHMLKHMVRHKVRKHRHRWVDGESRRSSKIWEFGFQGEKTLHLMASVRRWQKCERPIWKLLNKLMLQLKLLLWYLIGGIFENVLKICIPNIWNSTISLIWFVEPGN